MGSRVRVFRHRRTWSSDQKRRIVAEALVTDGSISAVARRHDVNANLLFTWMRDPRFREAALDNQACFVPVEVLASVEPTREPVGHIEIQLCYGTQVRCDQSVDGNALARVIQALRQTS